MSRDKIMIAEMTQPEVEAALRQEPVLFVPMGSLENQGPQNFMGDYLMATRIAELAADRARAAGQLVLVAPTLPFGCWDAFAGAPGCITLRPDTFRLVLRDLLTPWVEHGVRHIVIVNGHSGNVEPIYEVTNAILETNKIAIPSLYLWKAAYFIMERQIGREAAMASAGHGANALGSVAMHLFPEHVRRDQAAPPHPRGSVLGLPIGAFSEVRFRDLPLDMPASIRDTSINGVTGGDMRSCSRELGEAITEELVETLAQLAAHMTHWQGPLTAIT